VSRDIRGFLGGCEAGYSRSAVPACAVAWIARGGGSQASVRAPRVMDLDPGPRRPAAIVLAREGRIHRTFLLADAADPLGERVLREVLRGPRTRVGRCHVSSSGLFPTSHLAAVCWNKGRPLRACLRNAPGRMAAGPAGWLPPPPRVRRTGRCASVTDSSRIRSLVGPRHPASRARNPPVGLLFKQALSRDYSVGHEI